MAELKLSPFKATKVLKGHIDELLDVVSKASLTYKRGMSHAVSSGWDEHAEEKFKQTSECETSGDNLLDAIGKSLYIEMLLPDTAGDVLGLLGSLDRLLDEMESGLLIMRIELPEIPTEFHAQWLDCISQASEAVDEVVSAARSYFRDPQTARDHIHKVHFFEKETQQTALRIIEKVFRSDLPLDRKLQIRGHVWLLHRLADLADRAGDAIAVYAVKRSV